LRYSIDVDQEVEMDIVVDSQGIKAIGVTLPGGLPIENTRIVYFKPRRRKYFLTQLYLLI
jgi:hypothetical protein